MAGIPEQDLEWLFDQLAACTPATADLALWSDSSTRWQPEIVPMSKGLATRLAKDLTDIINGIVQHKTALISGGSESHAHQDEVLVWRRGNVEDSRKFLGALAALEGTAVPSPPNASTLLAAKAYSLRIPVSNAEDTTAPAYIHAVRKRRGFSAAKPESFFASFANTMEELTAPVFVFDDTFDVLFVGDFVLVLNQSGFEDLLGMALAEKKAAGPNARILIQNLARFGLHAKVQARLGQVAEKRARAAKLLHRIKDAPWLAEISLEKLIEVATKRNLAKSVYSDNGKLKVEDGAEVDFLHLLNEDFFEGDFSHESYRADRKTKFGA